MSRLYRKIPVTIEAIRFQYSQEGMKELKEFCGPALLNYGKDRHIKAVGWAHIGTLEDGGNGSPQVAHVANEGDYIIKGVAGEFYPCKADIFLQTYEEV